MKKNAFTLIELLVVIVILLAVLGLIFGGVRAVKDGNEDAAFMYLAPEYQKAKAQNEIADELRRQNDLMQRRLELLEAERNGELPSAK